MKNALQILRNQSAYGPTYWSWFDEFDRLFDGLATPAMGRDGHVFAPAFDLEETDSFYLMSFDLPGVPRESIQVQVEQGQLRVTAERRRESIVGQRPNGSDQRDGSEQKGTRMHRMERVYGRFERAFTLPKDIDTDRVEAHYEDGVLRLMLPKIEKAKPKSIKIGGPNGQSVESSEGGFFSQFLGRKKDSSN